MGNVNWRLLATIGFLVMVPVSLWDDLKVIFGVYDTATTRTDYIEAELDRIENGTSTEEGVLALHMNIDNPSDLEIMVVYCDTYHLTTPPKECREVYRRSKEGT